MKPVHIYISQLFFDDTITIHSVSAGIGRTGTYIAFDALCKEGKSQGTINVASYVKVMRSCRMNMVQTYVSFILMQTSSSIRTFSELSKQLDSEIDRISKGTFTWIICFCLI